MPAGDQKRSCLHLVVRASSEALSNCRSHCERGDSILFLDDGVLQAIAPGADVSKNMSGMHFFSSADLQARGLLSLIEDSDTVLSDQQIAGLMFEHDLCLTWK